ncbi:nucleotide exchange factor GrpE [Clostridium thermarum]|uniref:nucleotide exchange factor GrpE n=1 Tax=Clostridium thermarum TaxID=1716543 RepID=UPI0013D35C21|nr:nucleotide exchange factor GrpE [Clostridium thermarum]
MAKKKNIDNEEICNCCENEEKVNIEEDVNTEENLAEAEVKEDQEFEGIEGEDEAQEKAQEEKCCENLKAENLKLKDEITKLNNELEALKDRLMRTSAEYDNYRKRTAKEKEGIYTDVCIDVLKTILPIFDNLERAAKAEGSIDDLKKGIEMTLRQMNDSLSKLNVEEISTDGEFDPNLHNAVMHVEDESLGKNVVAEVFQKGYKRGDRVIRYSMVKVAN